MTSHSRATGRRSRLKRRYGITEDTYAVLEDIQGLCCAICTEPAGSGVGLHSKRLSVDHDHATGKIRGLLCSKCNSGLGSFKDSLLLLEAAADYLKRPTADALSEVYCVPVV